MTETSTTTFNIDSVVRIESGTHAGRIGTVVGASPATSTLHVKFETPVLLERPDGPTQMTTLPFAPCELELIDVDSIGAGPGKRRRLSVPVPPNRDHASKARHLPVAHLPNDPKCPACDPAGYAAEHAQRRADRTAA